MNHYETLFVVKATLTDEERNSHIAKIKDIVEKNGGEIVATDEMGMRKLAYSVEKQTRGYYVVIYFKGQGELVAELERNIKFNEQIIKFLTLKYSNKKELAHFEKLVSNLTSTVAPTPAPVEKSEEVTASVEA